MARSELSLPDDYASTLDALKKQVHEARLQAQRVVNTQLVELYWQIGQTILRQQETQQWGSGVVERLANDLQSSRR